MDECWARGMRAEQMGNLARVKSVCRCVDLCDELQRPLGMKLHQEGYRVKQKNIL